MYMYIDTPICMYLTYTCIYIYIHVYVYVERLGVVEPGAHVLKLAPMQFPLDEPMGLQLGAPGLTFTLNQRV